MGRLGLNGRKIRILRDLANRSGTRGTCRSRRYSVRLEFRYLRWTGDSLLRDYVSTVYNVQPEKTNLWDCLDLRSLFFAASTYPRGQAIVYVVVIRSTDESRELFIAQRRNVTTCVPRIRTTEIIRV